MHGSFEISLVVYGIFAYAFTGNDKIFASSTQKLHFAFRANDYYFAFFAFEAIAVLRSVLEYSKI